MQKKGILSAVLTTVMFIQGIVGGSNIVMADVMEDIGVYLASEEFFEENTVVEEATAEGTEEI